MMQRIDIRSPVGTVLIGSPLSIPAGFRARLDQHAAIRAIFGDPHAVERLRSLWPGLHLGTCRNLTNHDLRMAADHAITVGRMVAVLGPEDLPDFQPANAAAKPPAPRPAPAGHAAATPAAPAVPEDAGDRIIEALKRSRRHLGPELVKMIDQMLVPSLVIGLITFLLGLIALQFTGPVAAAIDGALIVIAWVCAGVAGITAVYDFVEATRRAVAAKTPNDLDAAGKLYADAFIVLGTVFLAWLLRRIQVKRAGGPRPAERTAPPTEEPAPTAKQPAPPPAPKKPPLDWSQTSKKGETRLAHIGKHGVDNVGKDLHGVFNGDPIRTTEQAWQKVISGDIQPVLDKGLDVYDVPFNGAGWQGGALGTGQTLNSVKIVTLPGTSKIITAFPE